MKKQEYGYFYIMVTLITPAEVKSAPEETADTTDPIIHDGSGGAFEGTEQVSEEREDGPKKKQPTPY
ncbi:hypothetical protein [Chitinophaga solisilvae]|uniref:hypothetical protein n=1 Tax=Chitinophaga solisilvae TaxID=1233460 RepID=UPI0013715B8E|nr:hypothetical protein [Chitinophaga solisilvae]